MFVMLHNLHWTFVTHSVHTYHRGICKLLSYENVLYFLSFLETNVKTVCTNLPVAPLNVVEGVDIGAEVFKIMTYDPENDTATFTTVYGPPACASLFSVAIPGIIQRLVEVKFYPSKHVETGSIIIASLKSETMGKLINRIPGWRL